MVHQEGRKTLCARSVAQSCPTLCYPRDCSPPGSAVHGILQARTLEWVAISSSRGFSQPRDQTCASCISCLGRWILCPWATWEAGGQTTWSLGQARGRCPLSLGGGPASAQGELLWRLGRLYGESGWHPAKTVRGERKAGSGQSEEGLGLETGGCREKGRELGRKELGSCKLGLSHQGTVRGFCGKWPLQRKKAVGGGGGKKR